MNKDCFEQFRNFVQKIIPDMGDETLQLLVAKAQRMVFQKGDLFVKAGEVCQRLLFIHQGLFRYYILHEGDDITKDFAVDTYNPLFC